MSFSEDEISEFKIEASELFDQAEKSLLALDAGGSRFSVEYDAIFRSFHSIKGASGMMEMNALQSHMHELENLLVGQKAESSLKKSLIDHFLKGVDDARHLLNGEMVTPVTYLEPEAAPLKMVTPLTKVESKPVKQSPKAAPVQKPRAMVIDDDMSIISTLSDILESRGFEVAAFESPEIAVQQIKVFHPDVVLTDVQMPVMSGLDVLRNVRENFPDLPVVFISGHTDKNVLLEAIDMGVYAVLEKPFHMKDVLEICRNAIEKSRLHHLLNSSINLLIYQFADLDDFLVSQGKTDIRNIIDHEIKNLLEQRRRLKKIA